MSLAEQSEVQKGNKVQLIKVNGDSVVRWSEEIRRQSVW